MLGTHDLSTFVAASFLLWLTPGPDTMYILTRSISQGRRAGVMSALGIGSGLLIHTLLAAFKVAIFFLALLGPLPFMFLGVIFVGGGTIWSLAQAVCAASATHTIRRNPGRLRWLERLSGCVYIALGLNLLRSRPQPA